MHIELLKIHIFFFVTLDFLDWNFVKSSTTSLLYSPNFSCPNDDLSYTVVWYLSSCHSQWLLLIHFLKPMSRKVSFCKKKFCVVWISFSPPSHIKNGATVPYPSFTSNEAASPHPPATQWDLSCTCSSSHD